MQKLFIFQRFMNEILGGVGVWCAPVRWLICQYIVSVTGPALCVHTYKHHMYV